ncbi:MAG TPA: DUF192 domain-containing protein [Solirubrobacterales bacterium]|nr:DUF192 domain-containing protein [Solirubrobacterales bacterium]
MLASRLQRLPRQEVFGLAFPVAADRRSRLLGLTGLDREAVGEGLLIPRCASVHTFGMRFALDLVFLDREETPLAVRLAVPPRRIAWERGAAAVLELPAHCLQSPDCTPSHSCRRAWRRTSTRSIQS